ncbi:hypothetical protein GBAR_LOCUS26220, partial [Geodia barretti]
AYCCSDQIFCESSSCTATESGPPLAPILHEPEFIFQTGPFSHIVTILERSSSALLLYCIFIFLLLKWLQETVAQTKIGHGHIPFASHLLCTCRNSFSNILGTPGKDQLRLSFIS